MRLQIALPENVTIRGYQGFAPSPDGTKLAFIATGADHQSRLAMSAGECIGSIHATLMRRWRWQTT
jgi:hypothetical protein